MKYIYFTIFLYLFISSTASIEAAESGAKATVKASIPEKTNIRLYGYTAPNSIVQVTGIRIFAQTSSDKTGYFAIDSLPISFEAKEICATTIDSEKRSGFPLCISLPETNKPTEIGPVLLSPTLSISAGKILQKEMANASGFTIPNSKVAISFFEVPKNNLAEKLDNYLVKILKPEAEAADLPLVTASSDKKGAYSINLPTSRATSYRLWTKAFFKEAPTPKSLTLSFRVDSYTQFWLRNVLPKLIILLLFLAFIYFLVTKEAKERYARSYIAEFNEKKLKPFVVRRRLQLRRLWYNFREYFRSNRK
ncbi:hypothetical protein HZB96_02760 [Candidatus Gottesmanbacteria bacterium]|nr:hypothetical protein [Candidatus Gottesmanbacteria bacterium]MBI5452156.1 hypothetical protein [Candidatus Gottesmanbacteria bacterium]